MRRRSVFPLAAMQSLLNENAKNQPLLSVYTSKYFCEWHLNKDVYVRYEDPLIHSLKLESAEQFPGAPLTATSPERSKVRKKPSSTALQCFARANIT